MKRYTPGDEQRLDLQSPRSIDQLMPALGALRWWFRYQVRDLERIPRSGAALLVLNHGPLPVDAVLLGGAIYEAIGRLPRALTDHLVFKVPALRELFLTLGAVDGRHDTADALLQGGNLVIVMPGGAPEAFKPSARAYELYWRERTGFARLAIRQQVPVIPAACIGIDEVYSIPLDLFELGKRWFGVRSLPVPLLWGLGPLPRRVPLTHLIGEPIVPPAPASLADDEATVLSFRDLVVERMENLLQAGLAERHASNPKVR